VIGRRQDRSVIITASPQLSHGKVVHLMDVVKRQGHELGDGEVGSRGGH